MQFKTLVETALATERKRNADLLTRKSELEAEAARLTKDARVLLEAPLGDLGLSLEAPPPFLENARAVLARHRELLTAKRGLEGEIRRMQADVKKLAEIKKKNKLAREGPELTSSPPDVISTQLANGPSGVVPKKCVGPPTEARVCKRSRMVLRDWPEMSKMSGAVFEAAGASASNLSVSPSTQQEDLIKIEVASPPASPEHCLYFYPAESVVAVI